MTGTTTAWTRILGCLAILASAISAQGLLLGGTDGGGFEDEHGTSIVRMEDLDGDDVGDFAVGSPGGSFGGHVHIYSGRTFLPLGGFGAASTSSRVGTSLAAGTAGISSVLVAGDPEMQTTLGPFPLVLTTGGIHKVRVAHKTTALGNPQFTGFGNVLAEVGDISGDGISDFAVGQPDALSNSPLFGRVELRNGRTGLLIRSHTNTAPTASSKFGAAIAGLPDLDGDGVNDYAIGDPLADANGLDSGEVRGFSGANGALLFTLTGGVGDRFGSAVVGLKNVQVGGSEEPGFAVGAPFNDPSGIVDAGSVFVFAGFPPAVVFTLDGDTLAGSGGKFGSSLAAGQLSLASLSRNLLVGAPGAVQSGNAEAGRAFCFDMSNGALTNQFFNPTPVAGEHFGAAVACGSDRVGNGTSTHFIIGAPDASGGRGAVYVYNDFSGLDATFDGAPGSTERFGTAVAFVGCFDGDGGADFAASAPGATSPVVRVFSGRTLTPMKVIAGSPGSGFGRSLIGAGDPFLPGNMRFGMRIGAPLEDGFAVDTGRVHIQPFGDVRLEIVPLGNGAKAGAAVANIGDVDGDFIPDFAIGAPEASPGGLTAAGQVVIRSIFGSGASTTLATISETVAGRNLGASIAGLGDIDNDGDLDLLVGAPGTVGSIPTFGAVGAIRIYSADGSLVLSQTGPTSGRSYGTSVTGLGDVNNDGTAEWAAGAPGTSTSNGRVRVCSGAAGTSLMTIVGPAVGDRFGTAIDGAADIDRDGARDLLIGAPNATVTGLLGAGRSLLHSGRTGALIDTFQHSPAAGAERGRAVAFLADANGDCINDMIVGAPGAAEGDTQIVTRFGIPSGSSTFGVGNPGSFGVVPVIGTFGGLPTSSGNSGFGISVSCALAGSTAYLLTGFSNTTYSGFILPLDLAMFGFAGCQLLVSADIVQPAGVSDSGSGDGVGRVFTPVPASPSLSGFTAFAQWLIVDPGAANGIAVMSNALELTIL